jgi:hypothetical protein
VIEVRAAGRNAQAIARFLYSAQDLRTSSAAILASFAIYAARRHRSSEVPERFST